MKRFFKTALALLLVAALAVPAWAVGPQESDVYSAQMSSISLQIYNGLVNYREKFAKGEEVSFTFNGSITGKEAFAADAPALSALQLNYPEYFWIHGSYDTYNPNFNTLTMRATFAVDWDPTNGWRSIETDSAVLSAAVQALAEEAGAQGGPYEQLLYVHDWLTTHNEYNTAAPASAATAGTNSSYFPWSPLAALTDEGQPVCEGYSKAFKLVCDELGIPCLLIVGYGNGGDHMWNYVQLNGQWYAVDVTFDDPTVNGAWGNVSGYETHSYFLVGANTPVNSSQTFSNNHTPTGAKMANASFYYPALSADAFVPGASGTDLPNVPDEPDEPEEPDEPQPLKFADVDENAYYAPAVDWAVICGVTNGTKINDENGLNWFSPTATVTRGQAVTFLWRAMWCPEPETAENPFTDLTQDYYKEAVLWAVENGITNGKVWDEEHGVYEFAPDDPVTRGQLLTFLWRALGKPIETDDYEGKPWYADAELWGDESGCIYGTAEAYSTAADCPRADVVYYLWQAVLSMAG